MRYVNIIPKGRDNKSKNCYEFMDWYFRKNRKEFENVVNKKILEEIGGVGGYSCDLVNQSKTPIKKP